MDMELKSSSSGPPDDRPRMMKSASPHEFGDYDQLSVRYEPAHKVVWIRMHPNPRPCFNLGLLDELTSVQERIAREMDDGLAIRYLVLASDVAGVFNYGGDLDLFIRLIRTEDRDGLLHYAQACLDPLYTNMVGFNRDVITISLVQGAAYGGGLESALSSSFLIAEHQATMGFPEVLFNLFPGMGAYSLLSRQLGSEHAKRMILSGTIHTAEALNEMKVVDVLAEDGQGENAVYDLIREIDRHWNAYMAFQKAQECCNPITYDELLRIATVWVHAALRLGPRDIRLMERLVARQTEKLLKTAA